MSSSALTALPPPLAAALLHLQAFYRKYGARLPSIVAFLLALLIARQLAGLLWLAAPLPESTRWKPSPAFADSSSIKPAADPERIVSSHLFGEYQVAAHANAQTLATAPETSLNFTLLGILAGTREAESLARLFQRLRQGQ